MSRRVITHRRSCWTKPFDRPDDYIVNMTHLLRSEEHDQTWWKTRWRFLNGCHALDLLYQKVLAGRQQAALDFGRSLHLNIPIGRYLRYRFLDVGL